ncbi:protein phosphatase 2C domain-containing protein [Actinomadura sp. 7K534]|uniref:PP2C family protein-serine/threonine phosphatase n=1 Tax=Actinomadura sp. 7K534 TaxID=2530366 RepID=UPI0010500969|nr:protein phosphatase 2C domain-containing protein [Actinomadura sp. 7K534]TDB95001.1 serine/threonine protein phosphatase [Actinomadura sp. 7K534]
MAADQDLHAGLCRTCGEPVHEHDRFCEECGRPDPTTAPPSAAPLNGVPLRAADSPGLGSERAVCADCGGGDVGTDGYCGQCGLRQPTGREHVEAELGGFAAAVSDRGLRRGRNEDAFALAPLPNGACAVVCDGVATAPGSEEASRLAADAAAAVLAGRVARGTDPRDATREAVERAAEIVTRLAASPESAPACTFVSAVVDGPDVTVGWVGDSRAYWLSAGGSCMLTRDDSWAVEMVERGEMSAADAWADRRAHLLTAWLGADAGPVEPRLAAFRPAAPGLVLLCSDGLWNHLPGAAELAAVALHAADGPRGAARRLLRAALDAGGHDNVTVAVIPCPPPDTSREPGR